MSSPEKLNESAGVPSDPLPASVTQSGETLDWEGLKIPASLLELFPAHFARENKFLPVFLEDDLLQVLMSNPKDFQTIETLGFMANRPVKVTQVGEQVILGAIDRHYGHGRGGAVAAMRDAFLETHVFDETHVLEDGVTRNDVTLFYFPPNIYREDSDTRIVLDTRTLDLTARMTNLYLSTDPRFRFRANARGVTEDEAKMLTLLWCDRFQLERDALGDLFDQSARNCVVEEFTWKRLLEHLTSPTGKPKIGALRKVKSVESADPAKTPEELHRLITFTAFADYEQPCHVRFLHTLILLAAMKHVPQILIPLDECRIFFGESGSDSPKELIPPPSEIKDRMVRHLKSTTGKIQCDHARFRIADHEIDTHVEFTSTRYGPTALITIEQEDDTLARVLEKLVQTSSSRRCFR